MSYFRKAFGDFAPHTDKDAAVKLCLDLILADERLEDLVHLLSPSSDVGGIEGDPGWSLERRDASSSAYSRWPKDARYRAFVDPEGYNLAFPEGFYDDRTFQKYLRSAMNAYIERHPEKTGAALPVLMLSKSISDSDG